MRYLLEFHSKAFIFLTAKTAQILTHFRVILTNWHKTTAGIAFEQPSPGGQNGIVNLFASPGGESGLISNFPDHLIEFLILTLTD